MKCAKCNKSLKTNAAKVVHEKHCDGFGSGLDKKKKSAKWLCPVCDQHIHSRRERHVEICDGLGPGAMKRKKHGYYIPVSQRSKNKDLPQCTLCNDFGVESRRKYIHHLTNAHDGARIIDTDLKYLVANFNDCGYDTKKEILLRLANFSCSECGYNKRRKCGTTILQMDHIDGDHNNNSKENLRILCPNCHALTDTFGNFGNIGNNKRKARIRPGNTDYNEAVAKKKLLREKLQIEKLQNTLAKKVEKKKTKSLADKMKADFNKAFMEEVLSTYESGEIDYSKFGWVTKLARKRSEKAQVVGRRVRTLMPEFYYEHCFCRGKAKYYANYKK